MLQIDKAINVISKAICDNISKLKDGDRGLLSQNILSQTRNLVEYVAMKIYSNGNDINPHEYENISKSIKHIKQHGNLRFLCDFHSLLQKSVSHYTVDKNSSERLMLKYYEYLFKIKIYLKNTLNLIILENINDFPLKVDKELREYYKKIAEKIETLNPVQVYSDYNDRYYVTKIKPFFINENIYYEVTFTTAFSNTSKFSRIIAFTKHEISDNYSVKFTIYNETIEIMNKTIPILIIDDYEISIRPCEINNFSKIFNTQVQIKSTSIEYKKLMDFLTKNKITLNELVVSNQVYYNSVKQLISIKSVNISFYTILDKCRDIILNKKPGKNTLLYLLYNMDNRIINNQLNDKPCQGLSNLYLKNGCIPFEKMPYCTSLIQHNPQIYCLLKSIPFTNREHEMLARYIKNNAEIEDNLFTDIKDIECFGDIDSLIEKYNNNLYHTHTGRQLKKYNDYIYIDSYISDSTIIIKKLKELSQDGVAQYTPSIDSWLSKESYSIDDNDKIQILRKMFEKSHVSLIYGSAGTGKSTLIRHIANFWSKQNKIFLAITHSAVENMKRKVQAANSKFTTIAKFISPKNTTTNYDIMFIDECSTVSNNDMRCILEKGSFKLLVLVGDTYQIESIYFGNWFSIAKKFIPNTSIFELVNPFRTSNDSLLKLWSSVRKLDNSILELLVANNYVTSLDESIFNKISDDEIVLCLNYDGLYGINNINYFLQNNNPNEKVVWGINSYKIGDPILFNEFNEFSPLIYNNSKGKIVGIQLMDDYIKFEIELEESINEIDAFGYNFDLIDKSISGKSVISFKIYRSKSTDDDDYNHSTQVPFQVAYAISIHKAQGLEYDSVKIIITNETEEQISHNIFYTAITRTKNNLKIYWSPETENYILSNLKIKNTNKDAYLLAQLSSLSILK